MAGRFNSANDLRTFETFNKELIGDLRLSKDGIINQQITIFKVSVMDTSTNLYGESTGGKVYKPGVKLACMIESGDIDFNMDEFGADSLQDATFFMLRESLTDLDFVPELGDIVEWNYAHFEFRDCSTQPGASKYHVRSNEYTDADGWFELYCPPA